ncbi:hypothetical protein PVAND_004083 [Polypedilum vanderplanki]|uniref:Chromo domain-containing protein n=1 Tax=Polypedilum vanderplanki TaxID=319348 RepID=A0A9J6BWJ3_POLVA|nr:hypothetical protein PVAND_004083 [Polypedilum vanderplanki]
MKLRKKQTSLNKYKNVLNQMFYREMKLRCSSKKKIKKKKQIDDDQTEYEVEKILRKRIKNGKTYYLLKCLNYDNRFNRWESTEMLNCDELIEEFESRNEITVNENDITSEDERDLTEQETLAISNNIEELPLICQGKMLNVKRPYVPKKIVGAYKGYKNNIIFFMEWSNGQIAPIVGDYAKQRYPELVIPFYQNRIEFVD